MSWQSSMYYDKNERRLSVGQGRCRNVCDRFSVPHVHAYGRGYRSVVSYGGKFCKTCDKYIKYSELMGKSMICPCCKFRVRMKPRRQ